MDTSRDARLPRHRLVWLAAIFALILAASCLAGCGQGKAASSGTQGGSSSTPEVSDRMSGTSSTATATSAAASATASDARSAEERSATSSSANDVKPEGHVCYLTFDDGPSSHTEQILDILDQYHVHATWFVIGNTGHLDKVTQIWDRGNQVGLHSYDHEYTSLYASTDSFVSQMDKIGQSVNGYLGFTPTILRFPGGSNNSYDTGNSEQLKQACRDHGWHYFDWNVSIGDSTPTPSPVETLVGNIEEESTDKHSCCVLMHDSDAKPTTLEALPQVIEYYQSQGYTFDVLTADSYGYHF